MPTQKLSSYFSDSFRREILGNWASGTRNSPKLKDQESIKVLGSLYQGSDFRCIREALLVVCPVVPDLVGEVAAKEAPHFFCPRILTIKEPTWHEVVRLASYLELFVRA